MATKAIIPLPVHYTNYIVTLVLLPPHGQKKIKEGLRKAYVIYIPICAHNSFFNLFTQFI